MFPLFSLPNELIDAIVESIDDRSTLVALAQTCKTLQPLAEDQLFKRIYVRNGRCVQRLIESMAKRPKRYRAIESLEATPPCYDWRGIEMMPSVVGKMEKLRSLKVESPLINTSHLGGWWSKQTVAEYMKLFEIANGFRPGNGMEGGAFGCLRSCELRDY